MRKEYQRERHLQRRFKMSNEDYLSLLAKQGNSCGICGTPAPAPTDKYWPIDHDHSCCPTDSAGNTPTCGQCVRGILCPGCNLRLDKLLTNRGWLTNALTYLDIDAIDLSLLLIDKPNHLRSKRRTYQIRERKNKAGDSRYSVVLEMWISGTRRVVSGGTHSSREEAIEAGEELLKVYG